MSDGKVLEFRGVTKVFGDVAAVSDLTARVEPGVVTGFVGPNGAGKSTTLRILLGEITPTAGSALIGGVPYKKLSQPRREVGALLENQQYRARRTAERHLLSVARAIGVPATRVGEVLEVVGLGAVGGMRIGGFSFGMRQRLGVAEALLGDPGVLIFDEPANGLDPEGIRWMRLLMRRLADEGRTVLMSSHVLSEVQQVADNILIISNGRLLFSGGIEQLADVDAVVTVDSPHRSALREALRAHGIDCELRRSGITVTGVTTAEIGAIAAEAGVPLSSLAVKQQSLEDVFLKVINGTWAGPASEVAAAEEASDDAPAPGESVSPDDSDVPAMPAAVVADEPQGTEPEGTEPDHADQQDVEPVAEAQTEAVVVQDLEAEAADEGAATDDSGDGAPEPETVDELPFVPATMDSVVAVDDQPISTAAPTRRYGDPLAFLTRPLSEIEKDVVAGEAELIAASPEGEQPTPGWVPQPEEIPSPAEEDADDPDQLETPDSVIELPEAEDAPMEEVGEEQAPGVGVADVTAEPEHADEPAAEEEPGADDEPRSLPGVAALAEQLKSAASDVRTPWPGLAALSTSHAEAGDQDEQPESGASEAEPMGDPHGLGDPEPQDESDDFAGGEEAAEADYSDEPSQAEGEHQPEGAHRPDGEWHDEQQPEGDYAHNEHHHHEHRD